jgi:hypothetical protein
MVNLNMIYRSIKPIGSQRSVGCSRLTTCITAIILLPPEREVGLLLPPERQVGVVLNPATNPLRTYMLFFWGGGGRGTEGCYPPRAI